NFVFPCSFRQDFWIRFKISGQFLAYTFGKYWKINNREYLLIGLAVGAVSAYFVFARFNRMGKREKVNTQSVVLMEKIRSVCKFITVEGDFSEIFHYENVKDKWMSLLLGKKKALVLIEAKAHIGFDLTK